jgi:hypothetical protein
MIQSQKHDGISESSVRRGDIQREKHNKQAYNQAEQAAQAIKTDERHRTDASSLYDTLHHQ